MMRGTVAMKMSDNTSHVCLGDGSVKKGDKVMFYKNVCTVAGSSGEGTSFCEMKSLGRGEVTKVLNSHYSEVKSEKNVVLEEGLLVEKI